MYETIQPGLMFIDDKLVEVALLGDLELTITWTKADGAKHTTTLSWSSSEKREANWRNAVQLWTERNISDYLQEPGQKQATHRIGRTPFYFAVLSGPPTWWLPRIRTGRWRIMAGWLRRGYVLSLYHP